MIHGKRSTYVKGCRCSLCRKSNADYGTSLNRRNAQVTWGVIQPSLVDAEPARQYVAKLMASGVGYKHIALQAGVSRTVTARLAGIDRSRPMRRCRPETLAKILAVPLGKVAQGTHVDARVTHRKLQALVAIGWSQSYLAHRLNMTPSNFGQLVNATNPGVKKTTEALVDALYTELHMTPGGNIRATNRAKENKWIPPLGWDDIDDLDEKPQTSAIRTAIRSSHSIDDIHELIAMGETLEGIANRFDVKPESVRRTLHRHQKANA